MGERIELDKDWSRWLTDGVPKEELVRARESLGDAAMAWVNSLVGEKVNVAPKSIVLCTVFLSGWDLPASFSLPHMGLVANPEV